ncbi:hypothetical protein [Haloarchaeobius sp. TZWWS8]|uniref:hypothetical protein n=1 Tax=Haloarchaeobius sp. TZWWS8 TaxID=3446121 RepID=UPI003EBB58B0
MSPYSRRGFLAAVGGGSLGVTGRWDAPERPGSPRRRDFQDRREASGRGSVSLQVRVHPDARLGWSLRIQRVRQAVRTGVEQVAVRASRELDAAVHPVVETGEPIPPEAVPTGSFDALFPAVETWLRERDAYVDGACHLYLANEPYNRGLGYGGANGDVAAGGAITLANVGATRTWDGDHVTDNIAVHEWLHTVLTGDDAAAVNGSRCEHDLGTVAMLEPGTALVTPLATAYADTSLVGGETRWHGSGCYDHGSFWRHDGLDFRPRRWVHTWTLSEATLRAATRFVERELL